MLDFLVVFFNAAVFRLLLFVFFCGISGVVFFSPPRWIIVLYFLSFWLKTSFIVLLSSFWVYPFGILFYFSFENLFFSGDTFTSLTFLDSSRLSKGAILVVLVSSIMGERGMVCLDNSCSTWSFVLLDILYCGKAVDFCQLCVWDWALLLFSCFYIYTVLWGYLWTLFILAIFFFFFSRRRFW